MQCVKCKGVLNPIYHSSLVKGSLFTINFVQSAEIKSFAPRLMPCGLLIAMWPISFHSGITLSVLSLFVKWLFFVTKLDISAFDLTPNHQNL